MTKAFKIAKREYITAVRSRGFIIGLLLAPLLMGGSIIAMVLLQDQVDTRDRVIAVVDRSGLLGEAIRNAAEERTRREVFDEDGTQIKPRYVIRLVAPGSEKPLRLQADLSEKVQSKELHAFVEIDADVLHPGKENLEGKIRYHSENSFLDDARRWIARPINEELRRLRLADTGIDEAAVEDLFTWLDVEGVGLVKVDEKTGELLEARKSNEAAAFGIPFGVAMLMFILVMMGATPLLQSVMEEKNMKIAEVILGSVRPFDFMLGKVLGGLAVTLTGSSVYIAAALFSLTTMGLSDIFPLHIIPWFFVYLLLMIVMMGSVLAALGSACNDAKDAQNLAFPGMIPMLAPMFVLVPVIKEPTSAFSFWASMIPPFTPMLMVLRMSTSTALGWWEPWVGLAGVLAATALAVWAGGRIFRIGILMQGQPPNFGQILRWAIRG